MARHSPTATPASTPTFSPFPAGPFARHFDPLESGPYGDPVPGDVTGRVYRDPASVSCPLTSMLFAEGSPSGDIAIRTNLTACWPAIPQRRCSSTGGRWRRLEVVPSPWTARISRQEVLRLGMNALSG
jgi:hypothetical protein